MDLRTRRSHSIDKLPLLTTRWRLRKRADGTRYRVKQIKVAHTYGHRSNGKWITYARWLYERHVGPVPPGRRVIQKDGDLENFALSNLVLGDAADVLWIHCHADPEKSAANHRVKGLAAAQRNREVAAIRRAARPLPSRWYAVDLAGRRILNTAAKKLWQAVGAPAANANGGGLTSWRLGWPSLPSADACILAALVAGGCARLPELAERVEDLRRDLRVEPARLGPATLRSAISRLVSPPPEVRWIDRLRRGLYGATDQGRAARGPVCPYLFVRGAELLAEPRYREFALVEPNLLTTEESNESFQVPTHRQDSVAHAQR